MPKETPGTFTVPFMTFSCSYSISVFQSIPLTLLPILTISGPIAMYFL